MSGFHSGLSAHKGALCKVAGAGEKVKIRHLFQGAKVKAYRVLDVTHVRHDPARGRESKLTIWIVSF